MNPTPRAESTAVERNNRRTALRLGIATVGMFAFGYALIPLYSVLCDLTGLGGRTNSVAVARADVTGEVDAERTVVVEFVSNLNGHGNWDFRPSVTRMKVHPGEFSRTSYFAKNNSKVTLLAQAVPSVAPAEGSLHFEKIECFCFTRQAFEPGETKDMPIVFRIDPKLPEHIKTLTLSYSFFRLDDSS